MKIQCNVCESAEAKVLCCADEAALCWACDHKVHAANKLAGKHQRVPLSTTSSHMPKCDICQEAVGYFFCLEDRALLCRSCDVLIHTSNNMVSLHQRFLLTGVKVGLESAGVSQSSPAVKSTSGQKTLQNEGHEAFKMKLPKSVPNSCSKVLATKVGGDAETKLAEPPYSGGSSGGAISNWMDDFFGLDDVDQNYAYMDEASPKREVRGLRARTGSRSVPG
uniref:B box-type domain-containing protein n=1 Tax=Kalanchoe fedtschenkoi TaxID=63787 RepID=A0A7N0V8U2_KALFE